MKKELLLKLGLVILVIGLVLSTMGTQCPWPKHDDDGAVTGSSGNEWSEEWENWEEYLWAGKCAIKVKLGVTRQETEQLVSEYARYNLAIEIYYEDAYPEFRDADRRYGLTFDSPVPEVVETLRTDPRIESAYGIHIVRVAEVPVYPIEHPGNVQWGLEAMEVYEAWDIQKGSSDIVVAVVDTGIDLLQFRCKSNISLNPLENLCII